MTISDRPHVGNQTGQAPAGGPEAMDTSPTKVLDVAGHGLRDDLTVGGASRLGNGDTADAGPVPRATRNGGGA